MLLGRGGQHFIPKGQIKIFKGIKRLNGKLKKNNNKKTNNLEGLYFLGFFVL